MRKILLPLMLCLPLAALAQASLGDVTPVATAFAVTCEGLGSNKSAVVKSRLGFEVSAEVKVLREKKGEEKRCVTSWILHISGPNLAPTSLEVQSREDKPNDNEWGYENSFDVIGWSKDGARLLAAAVMAGGDWDETTPVIYDFQKRKSWRVELAPVFSRSIPQTCLVYFRPVRFTPTGDVAVSVAPLDTEDPCFAISLWALNYEKQTVQRIRNAK